MKTCERCKHECPGQDCTTCVDPMLDDRDRYCAECDSEEQDGEFETEKPDGTYDSNWYTLTRAMDRVTANGGKVFVSPEGIRECVFERMTP